MEHGNYMLLKKILRSILKYSISTKYEFYEYTNTMNDDKWNSKKEKEVINNFNLY